jgi:hypothetical protein
MMENTWEDHPRMSVWPLSTTNDRPFRSSPSFASNPLVRMPISMLTTKMPAIVTASMASRKTHDPLSPPMVPGSSVRSRPIHAS